MNQEYLTRKFLNVLRFDYNIIFKVKKLKMCMGICTNDYISIDHTRGDILDTLIHELLHRVYPKKNDGWVNKVSKNWIKNSTWGMKKRVLFEFLDRAVAIRKDDMEND